MPTNRQNICFWDEIKVAESKEGCGSVEFVGWYVMVLVIIANRTTGATSNGLQVAMFFLADHPRSGVVYNFGRCCLSICQTITFESLDVGNSYLHIRYISREYGSSSYMKVIGSRWTSQEQKKVHNHPVLISQRKPACRCNCGSPQCEHFIASKTHTALRCACSIGFSAVYGMADRMAWPPSMLRDRQ